jgi:hypothetical protein
VTSQNDKTITHINLFSGQHRVLSQKRGLFGLKTAINKIQRFMIVFIYQTTNLISILAILKLSCDGCLLSLPAYTILHFILHILYICHHCPEKKEIKAIHAGRRIVMVKISARLPEHLHSSATLKLVKTFVWIYLPSR